MRLTPDEIHACEVELARRSLRYFVKKSFPQVDPGDYVHNWHIDAMCERLEALAAQEMRRLAIAIPPGTMKSLICSVMFSAWLWIDHPWMRLLGTSFREDLAHRDNIKTKKLVMSDWYQSRFPIRLTRDADFKIENEKMGFREVMPFMSLTGSRGDGLVIDDPMSVKQADSPADRRKVARTFTEAIPSRLNDQRRSWILLVQQRLHEKDCIGIIDARGMDYEQLILPMEFEPGRRARNQVFRDPRITSGELLFPAMFPREAVEALKTDLGSYAYAGQYQQRPAPREGGDFERGWFQIVEAVPKTARRVRRWDFAATKATGDNDPDWTVGLLLAEVDFGWIIEDIKRVRRTSRGVMSLVKTTAERDGYDVPIRIPQDPGAAGKAWADSMLLELAGYDIRAEPESGSKAVRARPVSAQAEAGNIHLLRADWNEAFLDEVELFPNGAHDDQVDTLSGAFNFFVQDGSYDASMDWVS